MVDNATRNEWDWPFILYAGMVWLGYSEADVWKLTPRKWNSLVSVHLDLLNKKYGVNTSSKVGSSVASAPPTGYIDQLNW